MLQAEQVPSKWKNEEKLYDTVLLRYCTITLLCYCATALPLPRLTLLHGRRMKASLQSSVFSSGSRRLKKERPVLEGKAERIPVILAAAAACFPRFFPAFFSTLTKSLACGPPFKLSVPNWGWLSDITHMVGIMSKNKTFHLGTHMRFLLS